MTETNRDTTDTRDEERESTIPPREHNLDEPDEEIVIPDNPEDRIGRVIVPEQGDTQT